MVMVSRCTVFSCAVLLLTGHSFPVTSSKSTKKSKITNSDRNISGGGGGFGVNKRSVPTTHTHDDSVSSLLQFLLEFKSDGIGSNSGTEVGTCQQSGIRGIYATQPFNKGDIICRIPSDLALALGDPAKIGDDVPTMAHAAQKFLDMYVHHPKNSQIWAPYLTSLPTKESQFDPTPNFYDDEELELLEFPRIIEASKQRKIDIQSIVAETDGLSFEELQFATWLVTSRSLNIQISESEGVTTFDDEGRAIAKTTTKSVRVMVPYLDLANHNSNNPNAEVHIIDPEKDDAWFALRANRPIDAGREITICYGSGADSSVEIFTDYGFIPRENKIDAYMLRKGGKGCLSEDQWTTTLEEDNAMLREVGPGNLRNILAFRVRMKEAYGELKN